MQSLSLEEKRTNVFNISKRHEHTQEANLQASQDLAWTYAITDRSLTSYTMSRLANQLPSSTHARQQAECLALRSITLMDSLNDQNSEAAYTSLSPGLYSSCSEDTCRSKEAS